MYLRLTILSMFFPYVGVCLRPFCSIFNVLFSVFGGKLSRTKMLKTVLKSTKVMTYGATNSPSTLCWSAGNDRRLKVEAIEIKSGKSNQV